MRDFVEISSRFRSSQEIIAAHSPTVPVYTLSHSKIIENYLDFRAAFRGDILYAVKSNPNIEYLSVLAKLGLKTYDVCSLKEIRLIRSMIPDAELYYMHPAKPRHDIRAAYFEYGVRAFVLDSHAELEKILQATDYATDLQLFVRIVKTSDGSSLLNLGKKFGAPLVVAADLLKQARGHAAKLGMSFHVGSQCMDPHSFYKHIALCRQAVDQSGVALDMINVGGGFPVEYPEMQPPELAVYMQEIERGLHDFGFADLPLMAEPGRVLNARTGSLIVQVVLRKDNMLYINDGVYGGLFDAGDMVKMCLDMRAITPDKIWGDKMAFSLAGPTCDSLDMMQGPFLLPDNIDEGDWIEIQHMGVYSQNLRSDFCGFGDHLFFMMD